MPGQVFIHVNISGIIGQMFKPWSRQEFRPLSVRGEPYYQLSSVFTSEVRPRYIYLMEWSTFTLPAIPSQVDSFGRNLSPFTLRQFHGFTAQLCHTAENFPTLPQPRTISRQLFLWTELRGFTCSASKILSFSPSLAIMGRFHQTLFKLHLVPKYIRMGTN